MDLPKNGQISTYHINSTVNRGHSTNGGMHTYLQTTVTQTTIVPYNILSVYKNIYQVYFSIKLQSTKLKQKFTNSFIARQLVKLLFTMKDRSLPTIIWVTKLQIASVWKSV